MTRRVLKAMHDKLILRKLNDGEQMSSGGVIIPDNGREKSNLYEVMDVGPGQFDVATGKRFPMESKVGDQIVIPKGFVSEVILEGITYYMCREVDTQGIYAIIED